MFPPQSLGRQKCVCQLCSDHRAHEVCTGGGGAPGVRCIGAPLSDRDCGLAPRQRHTLSAPGRGLGPHHSVPAQPSRAHGLTLLVGVSGPRDKGTDGREGDAGHGGHGPRGPHHPVGRAEAQTSAPAVPCELRGLGSRAGGSWKGSPPDVDDNV